METKAWVFVAAEDLSESQITELEVLLKGFVLNWKTHGQPVDGRFEIRYDRFIIMCAQGVSGCSIDSMFAGVNELLIEVGSKLTDNTKVFYRTEEEIIELEREEFKKLVIDGEVGDDTIVFNNTVQTLAEIESGKWELPFSESWHAKAFLSK